MRVPASLYPFAEHYFELEPGLCYLDTASYGPTPTPVHEAVLEGRRIARELG